jgi:hypothetical protein
MSLLKAFDEVALRGKRPHEGFRLKQKHDCSSGGCLDKTGLTKSSDRESRNREGLGVADGVAQEKSGWLAGWMDGCYTCRTEQKSGVSQSVKNQEGRKGERGERREVAVGLTRGAADLPYLLGCRAARSLLHCK